MNADKEARILEFYPAMNEFNQLTKMELQNIRAATFEILIRRLNPTPIGRIFHERGFCSNVHTKRLLWVRAGFRKCEAV